MDLATWNNHGSFGYPSSVAGWQCRTRSNKYPVQIFIVDARASLLIFYPLDVSSSTTWALAMTIKMSANIIKCLLWDKMQLRFNWAGEEARWLSRDVWGGGVERGCIGRGHGRRVVFLELPDCLGKASQDFQRQTGLRKKWIASWKRKQDL